MPVTRQSSISYSRISSPYSKGDGGSSNIASLEAPPQRDGKGAPIKASVGAPWSSVKSKERRLIPEVVICNERYYSCFSSAANVRSLCRQVAADAKRKAVPPRDIVRESTPPNIDGKRSQITSLSEAQSIEGKKRKSSDVEKGRADRDGLAEVDCPSSSHEAGKEETSEMDDDADRPVYKRRKDFRRAIVIDEPEQDAPHADEKPQSDGTAQDGMASESKSLDAATQSREKEALVTQLESLRSRYFGGSIGHIRDLRHLQHISELHVAFLDSLVDHLLPYLTKKGSTLVKQMLDRRSNFTPTQTHFYSPHGYVNGVTASIQGLKKSIQEYQMLERDLLRVETDVASDRVLPAGAIPPQRFYAKMPTRSQERESMMTQERKSILSQSIAQEQQLVASSRDAYLQARQKALLPRVSKSIQTSLPIQTSPKQMSDSAFPFASLSKPSCLQAFSSKQAKADLSKGLHFLLRPLVGTAPLQFDASCIGIDEVISALQSIDVNISTCDIKALEGNAYVVHVSKVDADRMPRSNHPMFSVDSSRGICQLLVERFSFEGAQPSKLIHHCEKKKSNGSEAIFSLVQQCRDKHTRRISKVIRKMHGYDVSQRRASIDVDLNWKKIKSSSAKKRSSIKSGLIYIRCRKAGAGTTKVPMSLFTCNVCAGESGGCLDGSGKCKYVQYLDL